MCSGFPNGIPISFKVLPMLIGNANGTIDSPNGTIGANGKPMVPLVSHWLPMVGPPGVLGIWGEGLFIFRELGSTANYFRGAGEQAQTFGD